MLITVAGTRRLPLDGASPAVEGGGVACRTGSNDAYVLTQHVVVILANGRGLNLEYLAAGQSNLDEGASPGAYDALDPWLVMAEEVNKRWDRLERKAAALDRAWRMIAGVTVVAVAEEKSWVGSWSRAWVSALQLLG
jgi:hypothetical protein